jgi:hypothetical protein
VPVEAFYGWQASSLALLADGAHNLSDVGGLLLVWAAFAAARLKPNPRHTYGWRRGSILASFAKAILLLVAMGSLAWEALHRFQTPAPIIDAVVPPQIPLQGEPGVGCLVAQLEFDTAKVLANLLELSDQSLQRGTTLKAQDLSRLSIQRRTVVLNIVDINPDINYMPVHRRLLIAYVACQPLEVSIDDGSPRVKKGASISSILDTSSPSPVCSTSRPLSPCGRRCEAEVSGCDTAQTSVTQVSIIEDHTQRTSRASGVWFRNSASRAPVPG